MGGGTGGGRVEDAAQVGLSPRGRRHQHKRANALIESGSISAWAEAPIFVKISSALSRVYLRVGGGTEDVWGGHLQLEGLSPRGRRHPVVFLTGSDERRSISAWAEAPRGLSDGLGRAEVYLRVGGGTERVCESVGLNPGLSPRGRRHHDPEGARPLRRGSISAWAEAPARAAPPGAHLRVYLRVGGGTPGNATFSRRARGLSPRGRRHRFPSVVPSS